MRVGGIQKISLIDYPGRISATLFTQGCSFRCPYCHNPELVDPSQYGSIIPDEEIFSFLEKRRGKLEAVTVTGGEPTIHEDLAEYLQKIKAMGYLLKLDTNGSNPAMLECLINGMLIDFIAMDIKGPLSGYSRIAGTVVDTENIRRSIDLLLSSRIEHEFRTTVVPSWLARKDLIATSRLITKGRYVLQPFTPSKCLDYKFRQLPPCSIPELKKIREIIKKNCLLDVDIR